MSVSCCQEVIKSPETHSVWIKIPHHNLLYIVSQCCWIASIRQHNFSILIRHKFSSMVKATKQRHLSLLLFIVLSHVISASNSVCFLCFDNCAMLTMICIKLYSLSAISQKLVTIMLFKWGIDNHDHQTLTIIISRPKTWLRTWFELSEGYKNVACTFFRWYARFLQTF